MADTEEFLQSIFDEQGGEPAPTPAPTPEPTPEPTPTPEPSGSGFKLEDLGDYKSIDEVKERITKLSEVERDAESLRQKVGEYEAQRKEFDKPRSPYKNPVFYKMEQLSEKEPDNVATYQKFLFGNPDDKELFKIGFLLDNPEYKDDPDVVQRRLEKAYPILFDPDVDQDSQEYKDAKLDLELDAKKVRKTLQGKLDAIEVPDPVKDAEAEKAKKTEFVNAWRPHFDSLKKETKIPVNVLSEKDNTPEHFFDIDMTADEQEKYSNLAAQFIVSNNLPVNGDSVEKVKDFMRKAYIVEHLEKYTTSVANEAAKAAGKDWRKKVHNSDPLKTNKSVTEQTVDGSLELLNELTRH